MSASDPKGDIAISEATCSLSALPQPRGCRDLYRFPESGDHSILQIIGPDIWTLEASHFVFFRPPIQPMMPYPHRSIVIRLADQSLMVISPIELTAEIQEAVDQLGRVGHIISPNAIHHLYMGDWQNAYPNARMHASPGLPGKRKDLRFDTTLCAEPEADWSGQVDQSVFGEDGFLPEVVFHHRVSKTVVFTDLIMDFDPQILTPVTRITSRINQMYKHTPRGVQLANNVGREQSRKVLQTVRQWNAEHLVIAHSPWLCIDGCDVIREFLDNAFDWLTEPSAFAEAIGQTVRTIMGFVIWPLHMLLSYLLDELLPKLSKRRT